MIHFTPETEGDTSPEMLAKLKKIRSLTLYAALDAGPEGQYGKHYAEFFHEIRRRELAAIDAMDAGE